MTYEQSTPTKDEIPHAAVNKSHGHYQPVILTDTVGAIFLGLFSILLLVFAGRLLIRIRKLENQLREPGHLVEE